MSKKKAKKRSGMNNINDAGIWGLVVFIWKGHVTNWFWRPSLQRRIVRERVHMELLTRELKKLIPFIKKLKAPAPVDTAADEKVFSLWLQGEENAPNLIKKCLDSVRRKYKDSYVLLDKNNLKDYIELPDFVIEKWKNGVLIPAHLSDIIRIELLWKYGGYWMDATNFMTGDFPDEIKKADFSMLLANGNIIPHMFVQNCFIRAKKGDPLLGMWREVVLEYWKHNGRPQYYYLVQTLFRMLVTYNPEAKALFEKMPKLSMDPAHVLWYEIGNQPFDEKRYQKMCEGAFFQKCTYKPLKPGYGVNEIIPGSFADVVINKK